MDLRGKPSTFSADGTEKLVGEDGLDGGSLVVSMMAVPMDNACACVSREPVLRVSVRKEAPRKTGRKVGGDGWGGGAMVEVGGRVNHRMGQRLIRVKGR